MKKITVFLLLVALVVVLSACANIKAEPIRLPDVSDIESIIITQDNQTFEKVDLGWIAELVKKIGVGEPTTKESIQDAPNVPKYGKIDFVLKNGSVNTLFVYQEKSKWYIEESYQGVYLASDDLIEIIENAD